MTVDEPTWEKGFPLHVLQDRRFEVGPGVALFPPEQGEFEPTVVGDMEDERQRGSIEQEPVVGTCHLFLHDSGRIEKVWNEDGAEERRGMDQYLLLWKLEVEDGDITGVVDMRGAERDADPMDDHECEKVAEIDTRNDRFAWVGCLTEPVEGHEDEENACLHVTTPYKTVKLGINEWDAAMFMALMDALHEEVTGEPVNRDWLDRERERYRVDGDD